MKIEDIKYTTIFYTGDNPNDLEIFTEIINNINEIATYFISGSKLIETLHNPPPIAAIIFLDIHMPIRSAYETLSKIKEISKFSNIPKIVLGPAINVSDIQLSKELGASLYIKKNLTIIGLKKAIIYALSKDWKNFIPLEKDFVYNS